jgi:hypothetical protein
MRRDGLYPGAPGPLRGGIPLVIFGVACALIGIIAVTSCLSVGSGSCAIPGFFLALGVGIILVGTLLILTRPWRPTVLTYDPAVPPPLVQPVVIQQTIREETVKVRCRFCGGLAPVTATSCPSCGAPL